MLSFNNDIALKKQIVEHLKQLPVDETIWKRSTIAWDDSTGSGSFVGHIVQSEKLDDWEKLGLPKWLALSLDYFFTASTDLKTAIELASSIFNAIPVGYDVQHVGSQYLIRLITHKELGILKVTDAQILVNALNKIIAIQQQCLKNEDITASTWRSLRKEMIVNSQTFDDESLEYLISTFAEAAAWNPVNSRTTVSDSVRIWGRIKSKAQPSLNWTQERENHVRSLLNKLYNEAKAQQAEGSEEFIDVFKLLEKYEPEESAWLKAEIKWNRVQPTVFNAKAAELLADLFTQVT
ncbi:MAG: hypothetical protein QM666_02000 [Acinetobacter sp.]